MTAWLDALNPAQREAVLHDGGPLLVVAGAGSGKTRTLAARVARLISDGAQPAIPDGLPQSKAGPVDALGGQSSVSLR